MNTPIATDRLDMAALCLPNIMDGRDITAATESAQAPPSAPSLGEAGEPLLGEGGEISLPEG